MKRSAAIITALVLCLCVRGQHYLDIQAGCGVGSLGYELTGGRTSPSLSYVFGAGYTWFMLPSVGVQMGVQVSRTATMSSLTEPMKWTEDADGRRLKDYMGEEYTHCTNISRWHEHQELWMLQIPLGFRFRQYPPVSRQNAAFSRFGVILAGGVMAGIPLRSRYRLQEGHLTHTGWYEQWRLLLHDVPGRFEEEEFASQEGTFSRYLKPFSLSVYGEAGMLVRLSERVEVAIMAYITYMPVDLLSVPLNERNALGFASEQNGYTFMNAYDGILGTDKTGSVRPWSVGLKAQLTLFPGKTEKEKRRCMCAEMR